MNTMKHYYSIKHLNKNIVKSYMQGNNLLVPGSCLKHAYDENLCSKFVKLKFLMKIEFKEKPEAWYLFLILPSNYAVSHSLWNFICFIWAYMYFNPE